jgi:hypothetical protein
MRSDSENRANVRALPLWLQAMGLTAAGLALAAALRFLVIEPPEYGWACHSLAPQWWCPVRGVGIVAVRFGLFGFVALAAGLLALWRASLVAALLAVAAGAAGLLLYVPEPAAGGLLLGALAMLRR